MNKETSSYAYMDSNDVIAQLQSRVSGMKLVSTAFLINRRHGIGNDMLELSLFHDGD